MIIGIFVRTPKPIGPTFIKKDVLVPPLVIVVPAGIVRIVDDGISIVNDVVEGTL
jgi:hypothetical protein